MESQMPARSRRWRSSVLCSPSSRGINRTAQLICLEPRQRNATEVALSLQMAMNCQALPDRTTLFAAFHLTMADHDNAQPYRGNEKIIVAIDLGTTHSLRLIYIYISVFDKLTVYEGAVSFSHLYPGHRIEVRMVPEILLDCDIPGRHAYSR
jgi:hypothetical protein